MADTGILATAVNMLAAPREALQALRFKSTFLAPLGAIIIANAAVLLTYYAQVDVPWMLETSMEAASEDMTREQRERAADMMENFSPTLLGSVAALSFAALLTLWFLLNATYLVVVSRLSNDGIAFRNWFSMICWCSLPLAFGAAASLANILLGDATFLRPDRINPLAFSTLLDLESTGSNSIRQMVETLDITAVWSMALAVFGHGTWTRGNLLKSALIVLAPAVLFFGTILFLTGI